MFTLNYYYLLPNELTPTFTHTGTIKMLHDATIEECKIAILQVTQSKASPVFADLYTLPENHPVLLSDLKASLGPLSISDLGQPLLHNLSLSTVFESQPGPAYLHLILVDRGIPLTIMCWIHGTDHASKFSVDVQQNGTMETLLNVIKEKCSILQDPRNWIFYKTSFSDFEKFNQTADMTEGQLLSEPLLRAVAVFNDIPFSEIPCVIVKKADRGVGKKRHLSWDAIDRAKQRRKYQDLAPSSTGVSEYRTMQSSSDQRFLDFRAKADKDDPLPDRDLPPIEVLYPGFGEFLEIYREDLKCGFDVEVNGQLRVYVDRFVDAMSQVYLNEEERSNKGLPALNDIFQSAVGDHLVIAPSEVPSASSSLPRSDGHYLHGHRRIPCIIVGFKNEDTPEVMPIVQLASYYGHMVRFIAHKHEEVGRRSRLPTLGVTIIGPAITFYSLAYVGSTVYVPLSTSITCLPINCGGSDRWHLYAAFKAASALLKRIIGDAKQLTESLPSVPSIVVPFFPQITRLPGLLPHDPMVEFQITGFLAKDFTRHVYRATSSSGDLAIKFTRSYHSGLHMHCFEHGCAPKLLSVQKLPGGIYAVAMEYLQGHSLASLPSLITSECRDQWIHDLKEIVEGMHAADLVHGDLRPPNMICVKDKVFLLDFDWGGSIGQARYPHTSLNPMITEGRVMTSLEITKDDDNRILRRTLDFIRDHTA